MNVVLILLVTGVLLIDFAKLKKDNKKVSYLYIAIVAMALFVALADKYEFFEISPLEAGIEKMRPITDWLKTKFD